ncbi:tastin [Apteryx mantelli]|uniref:Tastin n=1 Tax=Apteryx mantelli TaxID=2696672 RepID=A0ABM4FYQ1_9AVES
MAEAQQAPGPPSGKENRPPGPRGCSRLPVLARGHRGPPGPPAAAATSPPGTATKAAGSGGGLAQRVPLQPLALRPPQPQGTSSTCSARPAEGGPAGAAKADGDSVPELAAALAGLGLGQAAVGPAGALGLARRVPLRGTPGCPPSAERRASVLGGPAGTPLLESSPTARRPTGAETPAAAGTADARFRSPFGSARRVPVTRVERLQLRSQRPPLFRTPCARRPPAGAQQTPGARWGLALSPQASPDTKPCAAERAGPAQDTTVVRLFVGDEGRRDPEATAEEGDRGGSVAVPVPPAPGGDRQGCGAPAAPPAPGSGGAAAAPSPLAVPPSRVAALRQRLGSLQAAPQRFHEACLDDECAFYTSRPPRRPPRPPRCPEPVGQLLQAQDAKHFIPIGHPGAGGDGGDDSPPASLGRPG